MKEKSGRPVQRLQEELTRARPLQARTEASEETKPADTLTLDFQPPGLQEKNIPVV